jgi:hypothetical protein
MAKFRLECDEILKLVRSIEEYGDIARENINEVLHGEGAELIIENIIPLIPSSGRNWNGKKLPASQADSLRHTDENLSVTVISQKAYQYLYFPDDGSTTKRHFGDQQFFYRGAEKSADKIMELCLNKIVE